MAQVLLLCESHPDNWEAFEEWLHSIKLSSGSQPVPRELKLYEAIIDESEIEELVGHLKRNEYGERVPAGWIRRILNWVGSPIKQIDTSKMENLNPRTYKRRGTGEPGSKVIVLGYIEDPKDEEGYDKQ